MKTTNMDVGNKILFILGMSLCGVLVFVLVMGIIVALFISIYSEKQLGTTDFTPIQDDENCDRVESPIRREENEVIQFHKEEARNVNSIGRANHIFTHLCLDYPICSITKSYHGNIAVLMARDALNPIQRAVETKDETTLDESVVSSH